MACSDFFSNIEHSGISRIRIRSDNFRAPAGEGVVCDIGRNFDRCFTIINGKCICVNDAGLEDRTVIVLPGDFVALLQVGIIDVFVIGGAVVIGAGAVGDELEGVMLTDRNGVSIGSVVDRFRVSLAGSVGDVGVEIIVTQLCILRSIFNASRDRLGLVVSNLVPKVIDDSAIKRRDISTDVQRRRIRSEERRVGKECRL